MKLITQYANGPISFESNFFEDERGVFLKVFNTDNAFLNNYTVRQINHVVTVEKHTLRGLHYQQGEAAEAKIFRVVQGAAQIAFVDVRPASATYLQASTVLLDHARLAISIPRGFATGYLTLMDNTAVLYTADNDYNIQAEAGLLWSDPKLEIDWAEKNPILSEKDKAWPLVKEQVSE
ncbi:dTDP-4-dehydrorhamnose 3,5-epimerase [Pontibacter brevis]